MLSVAVVGLHGNQIILTPSVANSILDTLFHLVFSHLWSACPVLQYRFGSALPYTTVVRSPVSLPNPVGDLEG